MHFLPELTLLTLIGYIGAVFYVASAFMKRMVPLRCLALASNTCFIGYGLVEGYWGAPEMVLNFILLPLNAWRLREILRLTQEIERAREDTPVAEWLLPQMTRRPFKQGEVLFRKGERADVMAYLASGRLRIQKLDEPIEPGALLGEIGIFSPDHVRTQTIVCETDGEIYTMTEERTYQLYYQNPKLGFYFMRLVAERLLRDARRVG
jgi:CRP/FNR family transcriptional regulator, cyclic AMP receptor protein